MFPEEIPMANPVPAIRDVIDALKTARGDAYSLALSAIELVKRYIFGVAVRWKVPGVVMAPRLKRLPEATSEEFFSLVDILREINSRILPYSPADLVPLQEFRKFEHVR